MSPRLPEKNPETTTLWRWGHINIVHRHKTHRALSYTQCSENVLFQHKTVNIFPFSTSWSENECIVRKLLFVYLQYYVAISCFIFYIYLKGAWIICGYGLIPNAFTLCLLHTRMYSSTSFSISPLEKHSVFMLANSAMTWDSHWYVPHYAQNTAITY